MTAALRPSMGKGPGWPFNLRNAAFEDGFPAHLQRLAEHVLG